MTPMNTNMTSKNTSNLRIGVRRFALACAVLASVAGATLLSSTAQAQSAGKVSVHDISFGPIAVQPVSPDLTLNESTEIALLLPAVQKVREAAARLQFIGDGWSAEVPIYGNNVRVIRKARAWMTSNTDGLRLHVQMGDGATQTFPALGNDFAIRVLPAVQNGRAVEIESASARHHAIGSALMADGSVRPVLIGLLLPAIQK
ncbi:MAG TPA: hypothetical protein PLH94_14995 [Fimbriimonadaceae bacterium]|nr:hypothetical protein [Fimbriimonadaceae bacterium]